jgi:hypothetical protein
VELPLLLPAVMLLPAAGPGLAAGRRSVPPGILLRGPLPVAAGELDLELVELVPFGIGALPFGNRLQRLQAVTGGRWLRFIHGAIISSLPVTEGRRLTVRTCCKLASPFVTTPLFGGRNGGQVHAHLMADGGWRKFKLPLEQ